MTMVQSPALSSERPFPGLRPFAFEDHKYFFGREDQTFSLYRLIDRSRFVAVVGSSGSGKSSLVRAGLLPLIDRETKGAGGRTWERVEMRPGEAPLRRLTEALTKLAADDEQVIARARAERISYHLRRSSFGVAHTLTEMESLGDHSLLIVVDQFEELFRYAGIGTRQQDFLREAKSRNEATQFVQLLLEASRFEKHDVHVLLTMRSDFIGECARFQGLPEAVSATQFLVPALTRDQLTEVILRPVQEASATTIEPTLVQRLLNDSDNEPDQLPVLQHCMLRLWEQAGKVDSASQAELSANPETAAQLETGRPSHRDPLWCHRPYIRRLVAACRGNSEARRRGTHHRTGFSCAIRDRQGRACDAPCAPVLTIVQ
jgi:hypothetical protein